MSPERDIYVDFLRSFSLVIVVIWHWVFTLLVVSENTVSPTNPIGDTAGMWLATWVLQVMPVFFFVGGFAHRRAFDNYTKGTSRRFLRRRSRRLLYPTFGLIAFWITLGLLIDSFAHPEWVWSAVMLVLSPLWFIGVYETLVLLTPIAIRAHWRWGEIVPVFLFGAAGAFEVLRFTYGLEWAAWVNFFVIWGFAHQLGFFYDRLIPSSRRVGWMFFWAGLFSLGALTNTGLYPRSMVGVPGERFSNMGPPTITVICLVILQVGLVILLRDWVLEKLRTSSRWQRWFHRVNNNAMPLYLFHTTGMAAVVALFDVLLDYRPPSQPTLEWWITRPLWLVLPALATWPIIAAYRHLTHDPGLAAHTIDDHLVPVVEVADLAT